MSRVLAGLAFFFLAVSASVDGAAADWPSYRGGPTQNMSRVDDPGIHPTQVWEGVESQRSEPCVIAVGETAYTVATPKSDFGLQRLFAVSVASGETLWFTPAFDAIATSSCPAADSTHVYYANGSALTAVDRLSGEFAWEAPLGNLVRKPVVSGGTIYVHTTSSLFALDAADGSTIWSTPAQSTNRPPLLVGGAAITMPTKSSGTLSAVDMKSGEPLWSAPGPILDAIGVGNAVVYSQGEGLVISRHASTGAVLWVYELPPLTEARKLVADSTVVYALAPSTDFHFQVNHLVALDEETGASKYIRKFEPVESCCGTTAAYAPFVKLGSRLYNHYRYFDAATGAAPGGEFDRTHEVFYDGFGCSNEGDSIFASVGSRVIAWKSLCSRSVLVARETGGEEPEPEGPSAVDLTAPEPAALTGARPKFSWKVDSSAGLSHFELLIDEAVTAELSPEATAFIPSEDLTDGGHTWSVVAIEGSGERTESETRSFTVDGSPPAPFALLSPEDGAATAARPQFEWEPAVDVGAAGVKAYELVIDGEQAATVPAGTTSTTLSFDLSDGVHLWYVSAVDAAGNRRETESQKIIVDSEGPQGVEIIEPASGELTGPRPRFTWESAVDAGAGVEHYLLLVDELVLAKIPVEGPTETVSFTPMEDLAEGEHSWSVIAVDGAGNGKASETRNFTVDASPPTGFALLEPGDGTIVDPRPRFDWEPSADSSGSVGYELIIDGEPFDVEGPDVMLPFDLAEGAHSWAVAAVDPVGNRTESETRGFTVDGSPPAPFALLSPEDGAVTAARPQLEWEPAVDVGAAGVDRYELTLDEEVVAELPVGVESFAPATDLGPGSHVWSVTVVDAIGNRREAGPSAFIVASPPTALFAETSVLALTETPVTFDASPSISPLDGQITGFLWDLDGDGSFETDTGTVPTVSHTYAQVEELTVSVKVVSNLGTDATASADVSVRPAPPAGRLGMTINDGARFTNDTNVTVSLVWPLFASTAVVSNDGGFRSPGAFALATSISWELEPTAKGERLPQTVYVRFEGGEAGRETYQDDIVLDQKKPKVMGALASVDGSTLMIRARDGISGVESMRVKLGPAQRPRWTDFQGRVRLPQHHGKIFVKVRDRAGNVSRWRRARSWHTGRTARRSDVGLSSNRAVTGNPSF